MAEISLTSDPVRSILLIGGTGFLGTNLASWLENQGHRVLVIGRSGRAPDGREAIALPLSDVDAIRKLVISEKIDSVVQMACQLLPASTELEYEREVADVHLPMFRLARQLADQGVGLTFVSSGGAIYGAVAQGLATEDEPCRPISLYGQAKLEAETHLRFLARTCGLRLLILRPSNPYGLHQTLHGKQGLVSVLLGRLADDRPLEVWGDGSTVRDYIFIEDAVRSMGELILRNVVGTYNVGSGAGASLFDVVRTVEEIAGRLVALQFHPARAADVPRLVLDITRLAALGLHHARPLEEGIRRYMEQLGMQHAD
ncbi:MAG: NAD-dependent epimerase/dehydratase family protein [Parvularcula sp.]|jgi:UDP-glucose 4-epimerase|nr:NAD-dependent epimerase/dehydratase family protein [Parvularcula sp.]